MNGLTDDEREALFTRPRELDVRRDTEALEGIVERIVARRVSVDRAKVAAVRALIPTENPELIEAGYTVLASDVLAVLDGTS